MPTPTPSPPEVHPDELYEVGLPAPTPLERTVIALLFLLVGAGLLVLWLLP